MKRGDGAGACSRFVACARGTQRSPGSVRSGLRVRYAAVSGFGTQRSPDRGRRQLPPAAGLSSPAARIFFIADLNGGAALIRRVSQIGCAAISCIRQVRRVSSGCRRTGTRVALLSQISAERILSDKFGTKQMEVQERSIVILKTILQGLKFCSKLLADDY